MAAVDAPVQFPSRDETLLLASALKNALAAYTHCKSEMTSQHLHVALNSICVSFCFGNEEFIRHLDVDRYASVLVLTLSQLSKDDPPVLRSLVVQAMALLADLVPRGGLAISTAKGIAPLVRLLREVDGAADNAVLEELLKCIGHISLEANESLIQKDVVSVVTDLEMRVETPHLRVLCLKCLCQLLASGGGLKERSVHLIEPSVALVMRFSQYVMKLFGEAGNNRDGGTMYRLSDENETYLLRLLECVALIYDQLLRSQEVLKKNYVILEHSIPAFVIILEQTAFMTTCGGALRDAVCSSLLTLYFTDPSIAIKVFIHYHVLHSVCKILRRILERKTKQLLNNGKVIMEPFITGDSDYIPFISEEQLIIPLLEFLLVILPPSMLARESDYYITLPHFIWKWDDDFHNKSNCNGCLSKLLEGEYQRQRHFSDFILYEISHSSRRLEIDFHNMQYVSNEHSSYPHGLNRHAFLSGYIHKRRMYCVCKEDSFLYLLRCHNNNNHNINNNKRKEREGKREKRKKNIINYDNIKHFLNPNKKKNSKSHREEVSGILSAPYEFLTGVHNHSHSVRNAHDVITDERVVDSKSCGFCCIVMPRRKNKNKQKRDETDYFSFLKPKSKSRHKTRKVDLFSYENFQGSLEGFLCHATTRSCFLQAAVIELFISHFFPVFIFIIKQTIHPVVTRHCSVLMLRCTELSIEYFNNHHRTSTSTSRSNSSSNSGMSSPEEREKGKNTEEKGKEKEEEECKKKLLPLFFSLFSQLGKVFFSLLSVNISNKNMTLRMQPFKEFYYYQHAVHKLVKLRIKHNTSLPTFTLNYEIQMTTLSSFFILHHFFSWIMREENKKNGEKKKKENNISLFNKKQKKFLYHLVKKMIGDLHPCDKYRPQSSFSSDDVDSDSVIESPCGHVLCPLHCTSEKINEIYKKYLKHTLFIISEDVEKRHKNSFDNQRDFSLDLFMLNQRNKNPLEVPEKNSNNNDNIIKSENTTHEEEDEDEEDEEGMNTTRKSLFSDILLRAKSYGDFPPCVQKVFAIHEYMLECENNLSSLIHEQPNFLGQLTAELKQLTPVMLDENSKKAFTELQDGLFLFMNDHMRLINVEETSAIERQPSIRTRCFKRNRVISVMANHIWTPLYVKLEPIQMNEAAAAANNNNNQAGQRSSSSSSSLSSSPLPPIPPSSLFFSSAGVLRMEGEKYTTLDLSVERETIGILPTAPLSCLAKYILFRLNEDQCVETGKVKQKTHMGRKHGAPRRVEPSDLYFLPTPFAEEPSELRDSDNNGQSLPSQPFLDMRANVVLQRPESANPSMTSVVSSAEDDDYEREKILNCSLVNVQRGRKRQQFTHRASSSSTSSSTSSAAGAEKLAVLDANDDKMYALQIDNIVFFFDGKPVTDLSLSLLEVVWKSSSSMPADESSPVIHEKEREGKFDSLKMHQILALWSKTHSIQYVIIKEPLVRNKNDIKGHCQACTQVSSPKSVFAKLLGKSEIRSSLEVAANILSEIRRLLELSNFNVSYANGRLCSALIYGFYNYLGVFMLPPLFWFPVLCASSNYQKDQHLASYILWNFPHFFSLEIRRALLRLLFSVRRIPTSTLLKMKESWRTVGRVISVHGLEWVTPDVNMQGTKKVIIQRDNLLESGSKVLRRNAMCPLSLSVEFENENGVGAGPAMEFYSLFSALLQEEHRHMWRMEEFMDVSGVIRKRVQLPLFPAPIQTPKSLSYFELLGLLVGRVLMEERVVDLSLHPCFLQGVFGNLDSNSLCDIDPQLDRHLSWLMSCSEEELLASEIMFVLPQSTFSSAAILTEEIELCPTGSAIKVDKTNVSDYVRAVRRYYCRTILVKPLMHFRQGLRCAIIPAYLSVFDVAELQLLVAGPDGRVWERPEDLERALVAAHGYTRGSPAVRHLVAVVAGWGAGLQRSFLRFVTGSTRQPLGGLRPPITVVRRSLGPGEGRDEGGSLSADLHTGEDAELLQQLMDASLPTVNTCVHYLKLPSYSSKALLEEKLRVAVTEGQESFLLT